MRPLSTAGAPIVRLPSQAPKLSDEQLDDVIAAARQLQARAEREPAEVAGAVEAALAMLPPLPLSAAFRAARGLSQGTCDFAIVVAHSTAPPARFWTCCRVALARPCSPAQPPLCSLARHCATHLPRNPRHKQACSGTCLRRCSWWRCCARRGRRRAAPRRAACRHRRRRRTCAVFSSPRRFPTARTPCR